MRDLWLGIPLCGSWQTMRHNPHHLSFHRNRGCIACTVAYVKYLNAGITQTNPLHTAVPSGISSMPIITKPSGKIVPGAGMPGVPEVASSADILAQGLQSRSVFMSRNHSFMLCFCVRKWVSCKGDSLSICAKCAGLLKSCESGWFMNGYNILEESLKYLFCSLNVLVADS